VHKRFEDHHRNLLFLDRKQYPFVAGTPTDEMSLFGKIPLRTAEVVNSLGMKFRRIPAGKFLMGSPETEMYRFPDEFQHPVEITRPLYLGVYEVTQAEYAQVATIDWPFRTKPACPVAGVTWHDAVAFCKELGRRPEEWKAGRTYRLPTEAEWEHACRCAGKFTESAPFYFDKPGFDLAAADACFCGFYPYGKGKKGEASQATSPVGSYQPYALGLFDMQGNVWEWCSDWYDEDYYRKSPLRDPAGPGRGTERVLRGGSMAAAGSVCRAASRFGLHPDTRRVTVGFRVVLVIP
jgi:formylglycine-generating enzyme required for sulfatase activity